MSDHMHESFDVYGLDGTRQDAREALQLVAGLREDLAAAEARIRALEELTSVYGETLDDLRNRVYALEHSTPQARQLRYEADVAAADLAASGYADDPPIGAERHGPGCLCPYCPDEDEEAAR